MYRTVWMHMQICIYIVHEIQLVPFPLDMHEADFQSDSRLAKQACTVKQRNPFVFWGEEA